MNQDLSIVTLVLHASLVVQVVIVGLLLTSLASWTVIFGKLFGLRRVRNENEDFEREFWAGKNLNDLYNDAAKRADTAAPIARKVMDAWINGVMPDGSHIGAVATAVDPLFANVESEVRTTLKAAAPPSDVAPVPDDTVPDDTAPVDDDQAGAQ